MDIIVINGRVIDGRHKWKTLDITIKSNSSIYTSQWLAEVISFNI
jgi:hypothetical protein